MNRRHYANLIENFCTLFGLGNPDAIVGGGPIEVDGIKFSLVYSEKIDSELMFIYCDFGAPPVDRDSDIYRALLKQNLFFHKPGGPVFTISPDTDRVLLAQYERVNDITPEALLHRLSQLSIQAQSWRNDPLFSDKNRTPAPEIKRTSTEAAVRRRWG